MNRDALVDMVRSDLRRWGIRIPRHTIVYERLPPDELGYCWGRTIGIATRRLSPGRFYATYLHEVGHLLGLGHSHRGIMAAATGASRYHLTDDNRLLWSLEIYMRLSLRKKTCIPTQRIV